MYNINETALVAFVFSHYHESLKTSERAQRFLRRIGFGDPAIIAQLYLGFSDRSLGFQLPSGDTPSGASVRGALRRLGLFRASGHELLRGCVVFPLMDTSNAVIGGYAFRVEPFEKARRLEPVSWVLNRGGSFS